MRLLVGVMVCVCLTQHVRCIAQLEVRNSISGRVTDAETGEPLPSVNIYLSYTTIGTVSSADGLFRIRNIPTGAYDLVASLVGYEQKVVSAKFSSADSLFFEITLSPKLLKTSEVEVVANQPVEWRENLGRFKKAFIGDSPNADRCRILNPEVLDFTFDAASHSLWATTDSVLRIENAALGYTLSLTLARFAWNTEFDLGEYVIYPKFKDMSPGDPEQLATWAANRQMCYEGSLRHFLHSLEEGNAGEMNFHLTASRGMKFSGVSFVVDPKELLVKDEDALPYRRIAFPGVLKVEYRQTFRTYVTMITLKDKSALVDPYGNLVNPLSMEVSGSWAKYRVADLLPTH